MTPDIMRFVSRRALTTLRQTGLHKVAGAMLGVDEMNIKEAAREIGRRAYLRRVETKKIAEGIEAFATTKGEKTAGVLSNLLARQAVPTLLGAGAAIIPEMLSDQPVNQDALLRRALLGGALGLGAGALHTGHKALSSDPGLASHFNETLQRMHGPR